MSIKGKLKNLLTRRLIKIENGRVQMFNKLNYVMFPANSMGDFIQKIGERMGDKYLFDLGYYAGEDGANEIIQKLNITSKSIPYSKNIIMSMFETLGFGDVKFKIFNANQGRILINLTEHPVIDYAKYRFGNNSIVCPHYMGIFSIHAEKELKVKDCYFKETQCICKGSNFCEWSSGVFKDTPQFLQR